MSLQQCGAGASPAAEELGAYWLHLSEREQSSGSVPEGHEIPGGGSWQFITVSVPGVFSTQHKLDASPAKAGAAEAESARAKSRIGIKVSRFILHRSFKSFIRLENALPPE